MISGVGFMVVSGLGVCSGDFGSGGAGGMLIMVGMIAGYSGFRFCCRLFSEDIFTTFMVGVIGV